MPRREEAKQERRDKIVEAARDLIRETESTAFSMQKLARRAGVSLVTPYNLFGSKHAVLNVLLDEDIHQYGEQLLRSRKDPLSMFFQAVTLGKKYFNQDQQYYRAVMSAVYSNNGSEYRSQFRGPRLALWSELVEEAKHQSYLVKNANVNAVGYQLSAIYFANILEWVVGEMNLREMELRTHFGFALSLLPLTEKPHQRTVRQVLDDSQQLLFRYWQA